MSYVAVHTDVQIAYKKMRIELFPDSYVDRKGNNKNFEKDGLKDVRAHLHEIRISLRCKVTSLLTCT